MAPVPQMFGMAPATLLGCLVLSAVWVPASEAARLQVRRHAADPDAGDAKGKAPADSKTIEGPDCGNVKQVISHWAKAKKVGKVAGQARGAVMHAEHVSDLVSKAVEAAKTIGTEANGGEAPSDAVAAAVKDAETAATDLDGISTELSTELDTFNTKRSGAEFPDTGVEDTDSSKLKELTRKANDAVKLAQDAAVNAVKQAKKEEAKAKAATEESMGKVKAFLEKGQASLKESKDVAQKAGWLQKDAKDKVTKADTTDTDLGTDDKVKPEVLGTNGSQKPVLEAFVEDLRKTAEGVTEAETELKTAVTDLETAQGELEGILTSMKEVTDKASTGDASGVADEEKKLVESEGKLTDFDLAVQKVEAKMETLEGRVDKLDEKQKKAESMLKPVTGAK